MSEQGNLKKCRYGHAQNKIYYVRFYSCIPQLFFNLWHRFAARDPNIIHCGLPLNTNHHLYSTHLISSSSSYREDCVQSSLLLCVCVCVSPPLFSLYLSVVYIWTFVLRGSQPNGRSELCCHCLPVLFLFLWQPAMWYCPQFAVFAHLFLSYSLCPVSLLLNSRISAG